MSSCTRSVRRHIPGLVALAGIFFWSPPAAGSLSPILDVTGEVGWSLDAGDEDTPLTLAVPPGSTVLHAFLYSSVALHTEPPPGTTPVVVLEGVTYGPGEFTPLEFLQFPPPFATGMQAFRADATSQVAGLVGSGSPTPFVLSIDSEVYAPPGRTTGTLLAVVYSNPSELRRRIVLADGGADPDGDVLELLVGLLRSDFHALPSVGIGFSTAAGQQKTQMESDGRRLTLVAGRTDDTTDSLTAGGEGDSPDRFPLPTRRGHRSRRRAVRPGRRQRRGPVAASDRDHRPEDQLLRPGSSLA